jgi:hypothetical protein
MSDAASSNDLSLKASYMLHLSHKYLLSHHHDHSLMLMVRVAVDALED